MILINGICGRRSTLRNLTALYLSDVTTIPRNAIRKAQTTQNNLQIYLKARLSPIWSLG